MRRRRRRRRWEKDMEEKRVGKGYGGSMRIPVDNWLEWYGTPVMLRMRKGWGRRKRDEGHRNRKCRSKARGGTGGGRQKK